MPTDSSSPLAGRSSPLRSCSASLPGSLNFTRCREAHCLITGTGFNALAVTALVGVTLDRHWYDPLSMTIVPVFVTGFVFEAAWSHRQVRWPRPGTVHLQHRIHAARKVGTIPVDDQPRSP